MLALLADLGAEVDWQGENEVRVHAAEISKTEVDEELSDRIRGSFLLRRPAARPLRARAALAAGRRLHRPPPARHPHPRLPAARRRGLGRPPLRAARRARLRGTRIFLDEASVMGTENAVMAAVLAQGQTVLVNAACEPHVQDLCRFLVSLGAQIDGIGSNVLRIEGVERLGGGEHRIGAEHIEAASFIGLAAVTGGEITIEDVEPDDLMAILAAFDAARDRGRARTRASVRVPAGQELVIRDDLGDQIPKIEDGPWPMFPADLTSIALAVATQARGTILIFEKMFENRLFFVDKLVRMGARIILCDPHRAVVSGPARLHGERIESPDIRAGMAMLIAALCAEGTSVIGNIGQIDRGYERIDERLRALGASIERTAEARSCGEARASCRRASSWAERTSTGPRVRLAARGASPRRARIRSAGERSEDRPGPGERARRARGEGSANVVTGLSVLDYLLGELARTARAQLSLEVAPGAVDEEVAAAGRALGEALAPLLRAPGASGRG